VAAAIKGDTGRMDDDVIFIGTFRIPSADAWLPAIEGMRDFVEANVPRVRSYHAYVNQDRTEGTVMYVHPDAVSLDEHLRVAAERIEAGTRMVDVLRIEFLGQPSAATIEQLRQQAAPVTVKQHLLGFSR
jgi:hypothetical protein